MVGNISKVTLKDCLFKLLILCTAIQIKTLLPVLADVWALFCDVYYMGTSFYRGKSATFCFALLYPYVFPGFQMSSGFQT